MESHFAKFNACQSYALYGNMYLLINNLQMVKTVEAEGETITLRIVSRQN